MAAIGVTGSNRSWVLVLYLPYLLTGAVLLFGVLRWSWQLGQARYWAACSLMGLIFAAGIHDWFKVKGDTAFDGVYLVGYAYSGMLLMMGSLLLVLLAQNLVKSQTLSTQLEAQVSERTRALQETHAQLLATQLAHVQMLERERLLQNLHDGFGTQLVTAQQQLRHQQLSQADLAQLLQDCIADLHLVISTVGHDSRSLQDALADIRHRTEQRMQGAAIQLHWDVQLQSAPEMPHDQLLQVLRILQEALNNAIQHAFATDIAIEAKYSASANMLMLRVADNGHGLGPAPTPGKGLISMDQRARNLGAMLTMTALDPGTGVELKVPLPCVRA